MNAKREARIVHRAAAVWRDPNFLPPAVAEWHSTPFSGDTAAEVAAKARKWCDDYGPKDAPAVVVPLGSGIVIELPAAA